MRIDSEHARKLAASLISDETGVVSANFDLEFMLHAFSRLSLWERGILTDALLRAAQAKRPTIEQRAILALFLPKEADHG